MKTRRCLEWEMAGAYRGPSVETAWAQTDGERKRTKMHRTPALQMQPKHQSAASYFPALITCQGPFSVRASASLLPLHSQSMVGSHRQNSNAPNFVFSGCTLINYV